MDNKELLEELYNLEFINFKYKTALLSSNKDLIHNEEELLEQGTNIVKETRRFRLSKRI
jgi:hypothetical protein